MPRWMASLTITIDDCGSWDTWGETIKEYARLIRLSDGIDWNRLLVRAIQAACNRDMPLVCDLEQALERYLGQGPVDFESLLALLKIYSNMAVDASAKDKSYLLNQQSYLLCELEGAVRSDLFAFWRRNSEEEYDLVINRFLKLWALEADRLSQLVRLEEREQS